MKKVTRITTTERDGKFVEVREYHGETMTKKGYLSKIICEFVNKSLDKGHILTISRDWK